jgi:microcystin synthetase protein McyA
MLERGDQYDLLRFLSNDSEIKQEMAALPMPEILFNYIGHRNEDNNAVIDQNIFEIAPESSGPTHSPQGIRQHAIAVKCGIIDNELTYTIVYSKNLHDKSTIKMIGSQLLSELRSLSVPSINIQDLYQTSSKSRNNSTPSRLNLNGNNNLNDFT